MFAHTNLSIVWYLLHTQFLLKIYIICVNGLILMLQELTLLIWDRRQNKSVA